MFTGKIYDSQNFYMKDSIKVDEAGEELFHDSQIEEIIFESVEGNFSSKFLRGSLAINTGIISSNLNFNESLDSSYEEPLAIEPILTQSGSLKIEKSHLSEASMDLVIGHANVKIQDCRIDKITASDDPLISPDEKLRLTFVNSSIGSIDAHAFARTTFRRLEFRSSSIGAFHSHAMTDSNFDTLEIHKTTIGTLNQESLHFARVKQLLIEGSIIERFAQFCAGQEADIQNLTIISSHLYKLEDNAWQNATIKNMEFRNTNMRIDGNPWDGAKVIFLQV